MGKLAQQITQIPNGLLIEDQIQYKACAPELEDQSNLPLVEIGKNTRQTLGKQK